MRWFVVIIAFLVLPISVSADDKWGCCVPPTGSCIPGNLYETEDDFQYACEQASCDSEETSCTPEYESVGSANSCTGVAECTIGCCCAGTSVPNSAVINSDPSQIEITKASCTTKGSEYTYMSPSTEQSCVDLCGGEQQTGGGDTHYVAGIVTKIGSDDDTKVSDIEVFVPSPDGDYSDFTDDKGKFKITNVPVLSSFVYAIFPGCKPAQSEYILVDDNIDGVELDVDCTPNTCMHEKPTFAGEIASVRGADQITFTAGLNDKCNDFQEFQPQRCDKDKKNCIGLPPQANPTITDSELQSKTTYCYNLIARFDDGTVTEVAAMKCIITGDAECMEPSSTDPWCGTITAGDPLAPLPAVVSCDEKNKLVVQQQCTGLEVCSSVGGQPGCVLAPPCEKCNGLLGFFAKLGLNIHVGTVDKQCGKETPLCYQDRSFGSKPVLVEGYNSCTRVVDCTKYHDAIACGTNVCKIGDGSTGACAWRVVNEELGLGVCASTTAQTTACSKCLDTFGFCNKNACEAISQNCYFDGEKNSLSSALGCIAKENVACRYYDTYQECTGGTNAEFNIVYGTDGKRTGTDNKLKTASKDKFGIGKCTWIDEHTRCIKNADMNPISNEDDCIENNMIDANEAIGGGPLCLRDTTPPITTFYVADNEVVSRAGIRTLPKSVIDDRTPVDKIKMFVCFGTDCYPSASLTTVELPNEGTATMRYFSLDASENSEEIKSITLVVKDYGDATLDLVTIEEVGAE